MFGEVNFQGALRVKGTEAQKGEILFYRTEDGKTALDVRLAGETVWLTQAQMAELFDRDQSVVSQHLNNGPPGRSKKKANCYSHFRHKSIP